MKTTIRTTATLALTWTIFLSLFLSLPAYAAAPTVQVAQISNFIKSIIEVMAGLAGMVATGYFVIGGFNYMTSSGNPQRLERAKRTILFAAAGLAITIAAFVISNIISGLATKAFGG